MNIYSDHSNWFLKFKKTEEYKMFVKNPVAYFCAEYALDSSLPIYAGGLGILSGDFIREAATQEFPLVSVGLFYQKAQSALSLDDDKDYRKLKILVDKNNQEIIITLPIEGRIISVKAWQWEESGAKVYLLDTDTPENDSRDRIITKNLYDENRDIRLKQEIILGIGGFRLLARLGYHASVYHLNEGHSAFLALELIRHEMEHQCVNFENGCKYAKKHILFTNHTLVPEGQEQFSSEKISLFMEKYAKEMNLEGKDIAKLGALKNNSNIFSMTIMSLKLSTKSNTVSELHKEQAQQTWPNQITDSITNGIFIKRWNKIENISARNLWECHLDNKRKLLAFVKETTGKVWNETDLVFVWARRLVEYKRPLLFLGNTEKLLEISKNSPIPIRIIFSGPTGGQENPLVKKIEKIEKKMQGIMVFIPNYSIKVAEILTAGADIWVNTPLPRTEACGTSGMKAGLNGALALSTNDGWVHEVNSSDVGWVVDELKEQEIFSLFEKNIISLYYDHLKNPEGSVWVNKMEKARNLILKNFSTSRVLQEYIEKLYIPILKQKHTHKVN